jgi:signal transduction histidine kinase
MFSGVVPAVANVYLLRDEREKPGVVWFLTTMVFGGLWALTFATFTLVRSPELTLAVANVFWAILPATSVSMFLFVYEYVSSKRPANLLVVGLFLPVVGLFVLSWWNPDNLVFTSEYYVDSAGVLHFPQFGGPVKLLVVKVYGYLLVTLSTGMLLGEAIRATGTRRRQVFSIMLLFSILALSTLVKVAELVPIYFDLTSVVFSLSGLAFAVSTQRSGLLKLAAVARGQAFEQVEDAILVASPSGIVVDANRKAVELFARDVKFEPVSAVLGSQYDASATDEPQTISFPQEDGVRYYSVKHSPVRDYRGTQGEVIVLTDVTPITNRQQDLELFRQVTSRIFRHNFRNRLNVIAGYAEMLQEDDGGEYATRIRSTADELIAITRKTKDVGQIFTEGQAQPLSLERVVERAITGVEVGEEAVSITVDVPSVMAIAHPKLDLAIRELVENAIVHNDRVDDPTVDISASVGEEWVTLFVADNGPGIPEHELQVLDEEKETDLSHGSGIGLWLVYWIVKRSNGELVSETTHEGSRIGVGLRLVGNEESAE